MNTFLRVISMFSFIGSGILFIMALGEKSIMMGGIAFAVLVEAAMVWSIAITGERVGQILRKLERQSTGNIDLIAEHQREGSSQRATAAFAAMKKGQPDLSPKEVDTLLAKHHMRDGICTRCKMTQSQILKTRIKCSR